MGISAEYRIVWESISGDQRILYRDGYEFFTKSRERKRDYIFVKDLSLIGLDDFLQDYEKLKDKLDERKT